MELDIIKPNGELAKWEDQPVSIVSIMSQNPNVKKFWQEGLSFC